uniref:Uncharacterized protein n=1 Tax=Anguilla anguilla TaxID=7936 RepID=A0A0E9PTG1_ANGAN
MQKHILQLCQIDLLWLGLREGKSCSYFAEVLCSVKIVCDRWIGWLMFTLGSHEAVHSQALTEQRMFF